MLQVFASYIVHTFVCHACRIINKILNTAEKEINPGANIPNLTKIDHSESYFTEQSVHTLTQMGADFNLNLVLQGFSNLVNSDSFYARNHFLFHLVSNLRTKAEQTQSSVGIVFMLDI